MESNNSHYRVGGKQRSTLALINFILDFTEQVLNEMLGYLELHDFIKLDKAVVEKVLFRDLRIMNKQFVINALSVKWLIDRGLYVDCAQIRLNDIKDIASVVNSVDNNIVSVNNTIIGKCANIELVIDGALQESDVPPNYLEVFINKVNSIIINNNGAIALTVTFSKLNKLTVSECVLNENSLRTLSNNELPLQEVWCRDGSPTCI